MADSDQTTSSNLTVPDDVAKQFPDLIELIKGSHSMDTGERQYWVDVLPIMSKEQIDNLRDILDNEKKQIEEATKAYSGGAKLDTEKVKQPFDEAAYLEKKRMRVEAEKTAEKEEAQNEEALLAELKNV